MSQVTVRALQEEDKEGYFLVRSLTYGNGDPTPPERQTFKYSRPFAAIDGGVVKGAFNVYDFTCTRGEALMKCGGIGAVAVLPHERRGGFGKAMMEFAVRNAREEGVHLLSLYGFSERYYRQFGYEVCGKRIKVTCPSQVFPKTSHSLPIRLLTPDDWQEIDVCYRAFAHARSGLSMRGPLLWERILAENRRLTIYAAGDPVEAYAVVSHNVAFWATDHISEVAWSSREGYLALMDILRGISINKKALSWYEPSDSPMLAAHLDSNVETAVERPIMFRVCDVPGALRALKPIEAFETFSIRVVDDLISENEGPWELSYVDGEMSVRQVGDADIEVDIRQFAQVLLGEPSFSDLLRIGQVKVNNPDAIIPASRLFSALPVYCPEFF